MDWLCTYDSQSLQRRRRRGSTAFMWFMIYVLMVSWLMRELCTYPSHDIAIIDQRLIDWVIEIPDSITCIRFFNECIQMNGSIWVRG